jgi:hypothetical protein
MKDQARFWDRMAGRYSRQPIADEAAYREKLSSTRHYFEPGCRVPEFGCGTGSTATGLVLSPPRRRWRRPLPPR